METELLLRRCFDLHKNMCVDGNWAPYTLYLPQGHRFTDKTEILLHIFVQVLRSENI